MQHTGKDAGTTTSSSLAFTANNTAGNWIAVVIRAGGTGQAFTVTDTRGNTYRKAIQYNETVDGTTLGIFYAENIAGGANTMTVTNTFSATLRFAILEYAGVATANSLDVTATAQGTTNAPTTGTATTTASGDLVIGLLSTANSSTFTAGSGYVIQERVPAAPNTKLAAEDRIQTAAGPVSANGTLNSSDIWGAAMAAFRPAAGGGGTGAGHHERESDVRRGGDVGDDCGEQLRSDAGTRARSGSTGRLASPTSWSASEHCRARAGWRDDRAGGGDGERHAEQRRNLAVTSTPAEHHKRESDVRRRWGRGDDCGENFGATQGTTSTVQFNGTAGCADELECDEHCRARPGWSDDRPGGRDRERHAEQRRDLYRHAECRHAAADRPGQSDGHGGWAGQIN